MFKYILGWPAIMVILLERIGINGALSNIAGIIISDIIAFIIMYCTIKLIKKNIKTKINRILLYIILSVIILFGPIIYTFLELIYILFGPIT